MRVPLPFFSEKWKGKGVGRLGSHRSEIRSSVRERGILPTECSRERRRYKSRYRLLRSLLLRRPCSLSRHATRGSRPPRRGPQTQRQTRGESFCTTQCGLQVLMVHRTNPWLNQSAGRRLPQKTFPATKAMGHSVPVLL